MNFIVIYFPPLNDTSPDNDSVQKVPERPDLGSENKTSETTSTPALGPKTGDDTSQSTYLTAMIVALIAIGASTYKLAYSKGFAKRKTNSC